MKKIVSILLILAIVLTLASAIVACKSRDEELKLYMPGEYIDEEIFAEFEEWYEKETGNKVTVEIETFDAVENVQLAVEGSKADYDLLCPSDYMVEYLIKNDLVQKVDKSVIDVKAEGLFKEQYLETAKMFDPTLEYAVPYMYGTLGIVYDITKTGKAVTSWESLFGGEFAGKRSIKDSMRDSCAAACLYNARNELTALSGEAKKAKVQEVFERTDASTVAAAKSTLLSVKNGGAEWDVDNVKFDMAANKRNVAVALMWSCDAGYVMNDYEDADGEEQQGNRNLWYVVPEEGGNVYIDAFVISKYAKNVTAANWFLKFLCLKDTAIANSEYAGAISPVAEAYDALYESYNEDDEMFEGTREGWKEMFLDMMFPSKETLDRCGIMKDFGEGKTAVSNMWSSIQ